MNITARGAAFGLGAGMLLGPLFGAVFANLLLFYGLGQQDWSRFVPADIGRGLFAILLMILFGGIFGGIFGLPTGLLVGAVGGFLLGLLARMGILANHAGVPYRTRVIAFSFAFAAVGALIMFSLILLLYARNHTIAVVVLAAIAGVPALLAGAIAVPISLNIMQWYQNTTRGAVQNG